MSSTKDSVEAMLEYCTCYCSGQIVDFIESLEEFYKERGFLTEAQIEALSKIYNNQVRFDTR